MNSQNSGKTEGTFKINLIPKLTLRNMVYNLIWQLW